jgi:arylsulfatase A-like enzyme
MKTSRPTRRDFLRIIGLAGLSASAGISLPSSAESPESRPNILLILTDQQSRTMLSCAGNKWLRTPAMDSLMNKGMRFERAYATNPVCVPSRFSLMTGFYPSAVGLRKNGDSDEAARFLPRTLGSVFRKAGYETVYGGKVHLPGPMRKIADCGFRNLTADQRDRLADACVQFLKADHDRPFLLVASFINPHDICYQAILAHDAALTTRNRAMEVMREAQQIPPGISPEQFYAKHCPPLPDNHEPTAPEPLAVTQFLKSRPFKQYVRENWTDEDWRLHRWTYARLTERVDRQVARVLDALRLAGLEDNTVVVFTSDHGDMDASHRMEHKSMAYEQSSSVPLMIQYPPLTKAGYVDREHLVSNGLDIFPTLCDLAGVPRPADLPGLSLKPLLTPAPVPTWRSCLMIETELSHAITDGRYKYTLFDTVGPEEMLCDLQTDPGEMKNLAGLPQYDDVLRHLRSALAAEARKHGAAIFPEPLSPPPLKQPAPPAEPLP